MASYRIELKASAERDIRRLSPPLISRIVARVEALKDDPWPRQSLKLSGTERTYRLRVGTYRVIYEVDPETQTIVIHYVRYRGL